MITLLFVVAALVYFIAACVGWGRGVPAGLACLTASMLVGRI